MLIDGSSVAKEILDNIKEDIETSLSKGMRAPCLTVVIVGEDPSSKVYVGRKAKACSEIGILSQQILLSQEISQEELLKVIQVLNQDELVDGILVQLPLPKHIDSQLIVESIDSRKDVDGFHPFNVGKMLIGAEDGFLPCTPLGIKTLLEWYQIPVKGKQLVVVGRSNIVGKPMAVIMMQNKPGCNATVTVVHSQSENFTEITRRADILVVAIGKAGSITKEMVKEGATVIDVGVNRLADGRLVGDVLFEEVEKKCSYITPVPGGVGPMTIAMLMSNTLKSYQRRIK